MIDNNPAKQHIGFTYTDELGQTITAGTDFMYFDCDDVDEIERLGAYFLMFLKQCGYHFDGEYLAMEGLSLSELEEVKEFVRDLHNGSAQEEGE